MANTALNRTGQLLLTNKSGGAVAQGDIVVVDTTTAASFTTTTTSGYVGGSIGVVIEPNGIANNAIGMVAVQGYVPVINLSGTGSIGDMVKTHTVAKQGVRNAAPAVAGNFAQALGTSATPVALLWGIPYFGSGSGVTRSGATTDGNLAVWNGSSAESIKDGGAITWKLIEEKSPNGSTATETFAAIPGTYRDLVLLIYGRVTSTGAGNNVIYVQFNGDTGANYDWQAVYGAAATPHAAESLGTATPEVFDLPQVSALAGAAGAGRAEIPYYASTAFNKVMISNYSAKQGTSTGNILLVNAATHWRNSAAITSILVGVLTSGNFASGTKIALYGIV